ncbi:MAG TPA: LemA family protein [Ramlibacter sp.]|jgi:LemA protein|uniref:LemA family protein n=1 Tax=Ramlibacter sp. TaxID=1917967 RepID=UPI002D2498F8|nr:LemA family protein [Ramlibacter sp.]HZY19686.1 LemA family protein [Ramlibacter sp.]
MTSSVATWIAAAVLLFWAVGAYNRLVRLRGDANAAFAALDIELGRQVELVDTLVGADEPPESLFDGTQPSFWGGLQGAASQLRASLAAARHRPLDPERIEALGSAQAVLAVAWDRAERDDAHDLAGPRLPETLMAQRAQLALQGAATAERFSRAVEQYNAAIAQFPALLLAWLFGFKRGATLPPPPVPKAPAV